MTEERNTAAAPPPMQPTWQIVSPWLLIIAAGVVGVFGAHPIDGGSVWTLRLRDIRVNGVSMGFCGGGGCLAAVHTGVGTIQGPHKKVMKLMDMSLHQDWSLKQRNYSLERSKISLAIRIP